MRPKRGTIEAILAICKKHPFWSRATVENRDACWMWRGPFDSGGYGYVGRERAHRIAWELHHHRRLEPGAVIRHLCDTPACINPLHLIDGTQAENIADRVVRERGARGNRNGRARLTNEQALEVYRSPLTRAQLARRFGISPHTVADIKTGASWSWLTGHAISHGQAHGKSEPPTTSTDCADDQGATSS